MPFILNGIGIPKLAGLVGSGTFGANGLQIRTAPLLHIQGYAEPDHVRADIREVADKMAALAQVLCEPAAWYKKIRIRRHSRQTLTLENNVVFHCREFEGALTRCGSVVAFVLTVGSAIDRKVEALQQAGDVLEALFLETAGWLAIEGATKTFVSQLRGKVRERGYGLTRRLGPGYADWALEEQRTLFSLFDGATPDVRLLESCAMVPKMSRSGVYGLRPILRASEDVAARAAGPLCPKSG